MFWLDDAGNPPVFMWAIYGPSMTIYMSCFSSVLNVLYSLPVKSTHGKDVRAAISSTAVSCSVGYPPKNTTEL